MKKLLLAWLGSSLLIGQTVAQTWEVRQGTPLACDEITFHPKTGVLLSKNAGDTGFFLPNAGTSMGYAENAKDLKVSFQFNLSTSSELTFWIQNQYPIRFKSLDLGHSGTLGALQPLESAGLASGLWQTCELVFSGAQGNQPAKIEQVILNGRLIQHQIVVQPENRKQGGFVMESSQGMSAFRNFSYLAFGSDRPIRLANLSYRLEETEGWEKTFEKKEGKFVDGTTSSLTSQLPTDYQHFILTYSGDMIVDKADEYTFTLDYQGVGELLIAGKPIVGSVEYIYRVPASGKVKLAAGTYRFTYRYQKIWWSPGLGLFVGGTTFRPYPLHESNSLNFPDPIGQIIKEVNQNQAELLRGFMLFGDKKITNAISIGLPEKVSVAFDLAQAAPLYFWRGGFADVTDMWHERGEPQLMSPYGVCLAGSGIPSFIATRTPVDSLDADKDLVFQGYSLNSQDIPTVQYTLSGKLASMTWKGAADGINVTVQADPLVYHVVDRAKKVEVFDVKSKKFWEKKSVFFRLNNRFIFPDEKTTLTLEKHGDWTYLMSRSVLPQHYSIVW